MSMTLNNTTAFDYEDMTSHVFSGACDSVSLCSFITIFGTPVGIASASTGLVFFISNGIVKMQNVFEKNWKEKSKHRNIALLARSKLNCIENVNFQDVFKKYLRDVFFRTHSRRLQDILKKTSFKQVMITS